MRRALPSRTAVLEALEAQGRPVHANDLAIALDVGPDSYQGLLRLLDNLVFDGVLSADGQHYKLEKKGFGGGGGGGRGGGGGGGKGFRGKERRDGVLTVNPRGFGFVASPVASGDDVFINA